MDLVRHRGLAFGETRRPQGASRGRRRRRRRFVDVPTVLEALGVDKAAIFSAVLERNALRRAAHLPLLDVSLEYRRAVAEAEWREHERLCSSHADALARCRDEAIAHWRARFGPGFDPLGFGGRVVVARETSRRFREHLSVVLGKPPPLAPTPRHPIRYGRPRRAQD
jgi:hypothetical protein